MKVEKINLELLKRKESARKATTEEVELYKNLFDWYGAVMPIVIDKDNNIYLGEAKYLACKELEITEIPCIRIDSLSEEDLRIITIAEQRAGELGEWDFEKLMEELKEFGDKAFLTGFSKEELEKMIDQELETPEEIKEIDIPEVEEQYFSQQGDIYLLGNHRLMCGDSTKLEDIEKLMNGEQANLLLTDPPYNINYEGKAGKIKNDNMGDIEFYDFLAAFYKNAYEVMKEGASFYIFHADIEAINFRKALFEAKFKLSQCIIWEKNSFILSRQDYNWRHEPCLYGWKEGKAHYFIEDYTQDTILTTEDVLKRLSKKELIQRVQELENQMKYRSSIIEEDKPNKNDLHPTMKPLKLLARLIINSSKKEENVLDCFGGSGSTLMTCEQLERKAFLMEYDEKFADVIVKRFASTGNTNIKLIRDNQEYTWEDIKHNFEGE